MSYIDLKKSYTGINPQDPDLSEDDREYWNDTEPEDVLKYHFKCALEAYAWDNTRAENVWDDDIPCGELHFIEKGTNKIFNGEFEEVPAKEFRAKYGCLKRDIIKLANGKLDSLPIPKLNEDDSRFVTEFIKFDGDALQDYTIGDDEDLIL